MRALTWFQLFQALWLFGVIGLIMERVRTLAFRADIDAFALRRAISAALRARDDARAIALVENARPAFAAEVVWPLLDPKRPSRDRMLDFEDALVVAEAATVRGMRALRVFATIASALGFLGAAKDLYWIFNGDHGILGLQTGLVESIGLSRAVLSIGFGVATSALALGSWTALKVLAHRIVLDCRRMASTIESLIEERSAVGADDDDE